MHHICNLCGVVIRPVKRRPRPGQILPWLSEIRAVERLSETGVASITGVGFPNDGSILVPGDAAHSYLDSLDTLQRRHINYNHTQRSWIYAFHNACWEVLLLKLGRQSATTSLPSQDLDQICRHLADLLYCLPSDRLSNAFPAHDFGDASRFWSDPFPIDGHFFSAEPRVPCFAPTQVTSLPPSEDDAIASLDPPSSKQLLDCFARLPLETIYMTITYLSSNDLCNSRLSSRTLALLTRPKSLPQSFWRSRFLENREMGFLCTTLSPGYNVDWEELYRVVKAELRDTSGSGHLRNRDRVWRSLRHLTDCLIPLMKHPNSLPVDALGSRKVPMGYDLGHIACGHPRSDSAVIGRQRGVGSRSFGEDYICFDVQSSGAAGFEIRVSFIVFDCTTYICGLRYLSGDRSLDDVESEISRVGLIIPSSEATLEFKPGECVISLRVMTTVAGVIGLGFITCSDKTERELFAGPVSRDVPKSAAVAILRPQPGTELSGALFGFDACKVVSVQVVQNVPYEGSLLRENFSNQSRLTLPLHQPVDSAGFETPWVDAHLPDPLDPSLYMGMDFGASDGSRLPLLSRIAAYHDDLGDCIRGFVFHYIDGTSRGYGNTDVMDSIADRWTCAEESAAIDGPGGERIISVGYNLKYQGPESRVKGVKMITNRGRNLLFCSSPCPEEEASTWSAQNLSTFTMTTKLIARTQFSTGFIQSLGTDGVTQSEKEEEDEVQLRESAERYTFQVERSCIDKSPRSFSVKCYTTAGLAGIKRVSVSRGAPGKTRTQTHISGLRLDFFSSATPVYVGQWFDEVDSLQFDPGDRIVGLTFWQTQETKSNVATMQRENAGKIAGLGITKTGFKRRRLEVCLRNKEDLLEYSFYENTLEDLCGLVWAFNHDIDYIQVVTQPPESKPGSSLVLSGILDIWPNSRFPDKLLWEVKDDVSGASLHVSAIRVFFRGTDLVGILFEYGRDGMCRSAGYVSGESQVLVLEEGEIPSRLDVKVWGDDNSLIFYTNRGRTRAFASSESSQSPLERPASDFDVFMLYGSSEGSPTTGQCNEEGDESRPGAVSVGIWVTMRIFDISNKRVEAIGPILVETVT